MGGVDPRKAEECSLFMLFCSASHYLKLGRDKMVKFCFLKYGQVCLHNLVVGRTVIYKRDVSKSQDQMENIA